VPSTKKELPWPGARPCIGFRALFVSLLAIACAKSPTPTAPDAPAGPSAPTADAATRPAPASSLLDLPDAGRVKHHDLATDLSRDGRWLAFGAGSPEDYDVGGPVVVWDVARGIPARRRTVTGGVGLEGSGLLSFSRSGKVLVACFDTNSVITMDATKDDLPTLGTAHLTVNDSAPGFVILPDEAHLLTLGEHASSETSVDWDLAVVNVRANVDERTKGPDLRWIKNPKVFVPNRGVPTEAWTGAAPGLVLGAGRDGAAALDLITGAVRWKSAAVAGSSDSAYAFSPDGATLAAGTGSALFFLDAVTGRVLRQHPMRRGSVEAILWDARGRRAAVVSGQRGGDPPPQITVYEGTAPLCTLPVAPRRAPWLMAPDLHGFAFSPDGGRGVVGTNDGRVVVFELGSSPKQLGEAPVEPDPDEWLGVYWGAGNTIVAITSREVFFVDAVTVTVRSRRPMGFALKREPGPKGP
jgi:hypothetical protein